MRQDQLLEMIANGESSKVEFKTDDVHPNALAEGIVCFAFLPERQKYPDDPVNPVKIFWVIYFFRSPKVFSKTILNF